MAIGLLIWYNSQPNEFERFSKDKTIREKVVEVSLEALDKFTDIYFPDGACDEGPGYWEGAGGALYAACLTLYDMTAGKINGFEDVTCSRKQPLRRNLH